MGMAGWGKPLCYEDLKRFALLDKDKLVFKNNFKILGKAHNQNEYALRIKQGCKLIFLSPIFATHKYSNYSILSIVRFNLISLNWKTPISALGGISYKNYKKIKTAKSEGFGGISIINDGEIKKPVYLFTSKRAFKN
jgi:thiamine monophosphate synthase